MKINITKPICFYDLETTGLNVGKDRIVSISVLKIYPDGKREKKSTLINPTIPIPKEASDVHKITDDMVSDKPTFKMISKSLYNFMSDSDIAGYNNRFYDDQLLAEEFMRNDISFPTIDTKSIDVCLLFKQKEGRRLTDAVRFYCGKEFDEDAHNSLNDTIATAEVFESMIEKYEEFNDKDVDFFDKYISSDNKAELSGRILLDENGEYIWNFGRAKGTKVKDDLSFGEWVLKNDFPETFKHNLRIIMNKIKN